MFETDAEVAELQAMFDAHLARANPHMRGIVAPERRLTARRRRNPACSAVHMDGDRVAIAVNGDVEWIEPDHPDHERIVATWTDTYGSSPYTWGDEIVFFRIRPQTMWAYAFHPEEFPA